MKRCLLLLLLLGTSVRRCLLVSTRGHASTKSHVFYAVEMEGDSRAARALAKRHGLQFISKMGNMEGHYTFKDTVATRSRQMVESRLSMVPEVKWVKHQRAHYRDKRATISRPDDRTRHELAQRQDVIPREIYNVINSEEGLKDPLLFNDPYWPMQWELYNQGQFGSPKRFDLNIMPVWKRNITGKGVVVTIIDDGVDHTNTDLETNFEYYASFDLRGSHGLSHDPMPPNNQRNGHGTRCAGEIAMEANNSFCGVGIAFHSKIGGIRLLDGPVTDSMEATALTYNNHFIDIYTCCWGPKDNGKKMAGPGKLTAKALRMGSEKGRKGKGSIFVWASGNGGMVNDHCGADGYVSSIYTIAIGAITHYGLPAFFGEPCPAVMAVTLTGAIYGGGEPLPLVTATNVDEGCVTHFTGTSSAAPMASGILALVLEANPELTWRDVQHLIAKTAKIPNPMEPGWWINGGGYHIHDRYGFGLLDAGLLVQQAVGWKTVRPQRICSEEVILNPARILSPGGSVEVHVHTEACRGGKNAINVLEHVQPVVSITSVCRGDLSIDLLSPFGTKSRLLGTRHNDYSGAGLKNWTLMSVHSWGEDPRGMWSMKVTDNVNTVFKCFRSDFEQAAGTVLRVKMIFYGTFDPKKKCHDNQHRSLVSMGERYTINLDSKELKSDLSQKAIIQEEFEIENSNKINANDIPSPHKKKNLMTQNNSKSVKSFKPKEMDDTDGSNFAPHLKLLWNTLRNNINWVQYKSKTREHSPQLKQKKELQLPAGPDGPPLSFNVRGNLGDMVRTEQASRQELIRALSTDLRKMHMVREMSKAYKKLLEYEKE
ncbi:PC3-like endoprotease variant B [Polyodon spathula]|uniref:PC3-like endoprotease variant B n=1 Tax=Polyodon spathula TaxID=7913 RepID=UPI001B7DC839|nr:PC3-like endoprotease variant B [Polyodon spathula]